MSAVYDYPYVLPVILVFMLYASYTDIKSHRISNKLVIAFVIARVAAVFYYPIRVTHLLGGAGIFVILLAAGMIVMHQMGGDIKFSAALGLWLGLNATVVAFLVAIVLIGLSYLVRRLNPKFLLPFAPYICIGTVVSYLIFNLCKTI